MCVCVCVCVCACVSVAFGSNAREAQKTVVMPSDSGSPRTPSSHDSDNSSCFCAMCCGRDEFGGIIDDADYDRQTIYACCKSSWRRQREQVNISRANWNFPVRDRRLEVHMMTHTFLLQFILLYPFLLTMRGLQACHLYGKAASQCPQMNRDAPETARGTRLVTDILVISISSSAATTSLTRRRLSGACSPLWR